MFGIKVPKYTFISVNFFQMNYNRIINCLAGIFCICLFAHCNADQLVSTEANQRDLLASDRAFCQRSLAAGMKVAFVEYADSAVIKMDDSQLAIRGLDSLKSRWAAPRPDGPSPLFWEPQHAEVATSGDMGFTFGYWRYPVKTATGTDTLYYGNYVSIWKRQSDGAWKYVLDTGTNTPKPEGWE